MGKMNKKLEGWPSKLLSAGAKLVLINSVLAALPIYYFAMIDPPISTISNMKKNLSTIFWSDNSGNKKHH